MVFNSLKGTVKHNCTELNLIACIKLNITRVSRSYPLHS